jgi:hypothetical protein
MSGTNRAFVQPDGGYTVSSPAPLRAPSPQNVAEVLRRHQDGDQTPVRSDGDVGWTSWVGKQIANKGVFEGLPDTTSIPHPRTALRKAIAARNALSDEMRRLGADLQDAEAHETAAREKLDHVADLDRAAWADWADGNRQAPAPANSLQRRTELDAIHQSAKRKVEALRSTYNASSATYLAKAPEVEKVLADAQTAVVLEISNELKERRLQLQFEIAKVNATLLGLAASIKSTGNGMASAQIVREIDPTNQRKLAMQPRLAEVEKAAFEFPRVLLRDPDATMAL